MIRHRWWKTRFKPKTKFSIKLYPTDNIIYEVIKEPTFFGLYIDVYCNIDDGKYPILDNMVTIHRRMMKYVKFL